MKLQNLVTKISHKVKVKLKSINILNFEMGLGRLSYIKLLRISLKGAFVVEFSIYFVSNYNKHHLTS
jgi:hypothetical protein